MRVPAVLLQLLYHWYLYSFDGSLNIQRLDDASQIFEQIVYYLLSFAICKHDYPIILLESMHREWRGGYCRKEIKNDLASQLLCSYSANFASCGPFDFNTPSCHIRTCSDHRPQTRRNSHACLHNILPCFFAKESPPSNYSHKPPQRVSTFQLFPQTTTVFSNTKPNKPT